MKIIELYKRQRNVLSLEIFPPQKHYPLDTIFHTLEELRLLQPAYISVTYGAGGSNRGRTVEIASRIKNDYQIEALAHLTSIGHTRQEVNALLDELAGENIYNVLALRGDMPQGGLGEGLQQQDYSYAADLIRDIKLRPQFGIAAAAYPEGHPESASLKHDLDYLKMKVEAGADFLITQLFFDNSIYYRFFEAAELAGIHCPIVPGIFPLLNIKQVQKISELSQATIPAELKKLLEKYYYEPASMEQAGIEYASRQTQHLLFNQVPGVHLYTMNKSQQIIEIVKNVGLA